MTDTVHIEMDANAIELGMMKALVIAPQWIGDAVMTQPLLASLHNQGLALTVAALPWVAPVYRAMPNVSCVIELPFTHKKLDLKARWRLAKHLRTLQFDVAYVLPNSFKSALLPWLARIPKRIGHSGEARGSWGVLTHTPFVQNNAGKLVRSLPMVDFYLVLAQHIDTGHPATDHCPRPVLSLPSPVSDAQALLPKAYVVFAPGAEFGPAKRWPAAHFSSLALLLYPVPVVFLGAGKEFELCQSIIDQAQSQAQMQPIQTRSTKPLHLLNLAGKTTLSEAFSWIAHAKTVVSNDSGLMHVAAAFGVPQVAIFGSSSPLHTPPLNQKAKVFWLQLPCAPCFQRVCPLPTDGGYMQCLNGIDADVVKQAVNSFVGTTATV